MGLGSMELVVGLIGLVALGITVLAMVLLFRDARRRGASDGVAALLALIGFFTIPVGPLVYFVLALTGTLDGAFRPRGATAGAGRATPEPGWYDDPEGTGKRWWDGQAWSEHRQSND